MGINKNEIEKNAELFRLKMGLNTTEAIDVKSILRKKNILTIYLPMSQNAWKSHTNLTHPGKVF